MLKIALFPGSFDPITRGHEDILRRSLPLFDHIIIAIGINGSKSGMFSLEQRVEMIHRLTESEPNISVSTYQGLTVSFAKEKGADFLIRGLRSAPDFEFERNIAQLNMKIAGIETVFLITDPALSPISSSLVREIYRNGGDVGSLIPEGVTLPPLSS